MSHPDLSKTSTLFKSSSLSKPSREIVDLERELRRLKRSISTIFDACKNIRSDDSSFTLFEAHYDSVLEDWTRFKQVWRDLDSAHLQVNPESDFPDDDWQSMYDSLQDGMRKADGTLRRLKLERLKAATALPPPAANPLNEYQPSTLPRISIPKFNGDLFQWTHFRDTFVSLVHNSRSIPPVDKMHHLRDSLVGEPASLLSGLSYDAASYEQAWEALKRTYDNPRVLATRHILKMLDFRLGSSNSEYSKYHSYLTHVGESLEAFKALKLPSADDVLLSIIALRALDSSTRKQFEIAHQGTKFPTSSNVLDFVRQRMMACKLSSEMQDSGSRDDFSKARRSLAFSKPVNKGSSALFSRSQDSPSPPRSPEFHSSAPNSRQESPSSRPRNHRRSMQSPRRRWRIPERRQSRSPPKPTTPCGFCKGDHPLSRCFSFSELPSQERFAFIRGWKGCQNCLAAGHNTDQCNSRFSCRYCSSRHHSLLHAGDANRRPRSADPCLPNPDAPANAFVGHLREASSHRRQPPFPEAIMCTAEAVLEGRKDSTTVRVLLDTGSQHTFITTNVASRIGGQLQPYCGHISGLGGAPVIDVKGWLSCRLLSKTDDSAFKVKALVVDHITSATPKRPVPPSIAALLSRHTLADPLFSQPSSIDVLIGMDLYPRLISGAPSATEEDGLFLMPTVFGHVVMGVIPSSSIHQTTSLLVQDESLILDQLRAFWELEEPAPADMRDPSDIQCEEHFVATHERTSEGRYVVRLPIKTSTFPPAANREIALRRFYSLERKFTRDPKLKSDYIKFMSEYRELGHMAPAVTSSPYVIPHHGVWQGALDSMKLRVVFDGSCSLNGPSLNDTLLPGPKQQLDICNILIRFRLYPVALTTDIVKMYRQVLVHPADRYLQHIFWREDPSLRIEELELRTVTYGLKPSAFQAIRTVKQLVTDEGDAYPLASNCISESIYVDDIVSGANSVQEALDLKSQLIELFSKGGFTLSKWASNEAQLMPQDLEHVNTRTFPHDGQHFIKILGLTWHSLQDVFSFVIQEPATCVTKRLILSTIARIFDPLGFLAPVVLCAKALMQEVWRHNVTWDEPLPSPLQEKWTNLISGWSNLQDLSIPRYLGSRGATLQLTGFSDASSRGYAAAVYVRVVHPENGSVSTYLIKAKTKVAPTKHRSIAQLELCGALLLQRVMSSIDINTHLDPMYFCDSSVVLSWLRTPNHLLKIFEANRVSAILRGSQIHQWFYVRSEQNPADIASRGCLPSDLNGNHLWWNGPAWLAHDPIPDLAHHPREISYRVETGALLVATQPQSQVAKSSFDASWMLRFSSLHRLVMVVARILRRFGSLRDTSTSSAVICASQYQNALHRCTLIVQRSTFPSSLYSQSIPKMYRQLQPFVDTLGFVRVGGRLRHSSLSYSRKHPLLLPKNHHFTRLIIEDVHIRNFHAGPTLTLSLVRNQFWIPSALKYIKSLIFRCPRCRIHRARPSVPVMADVVPERLFVGRAFSEVGVDFAGPLSIKESLRRKAALGKSYICIFVCLVTKAVHLELVSSLSTPAFLATLDRFVARRGIPFRIHSDNGTNFIGASKFLKDLYSFLNSHSSEVESHLVSKGIHWKFTPPRSPHFGGLWEAGVKSVKNLLVHSVGMQPLTFEELTTILARIEGLLNSRPLSPIREDPETFDVLTPGHFLIGAPLAALPTSQDSGPHISLKSRWHIVQQHTSRIWSQWNRDYLHLLQHRTKWTKEHPDLAVDDLVIMIENRPLVGVWPVARISEVFPGKDGRVRVVTVKTPSGKTFRRTAATLAPLLLPEPPQAS